MAAFAEREVVDRRCGYRSRIQMAAAVGEDRARRQLKIDGTGRRGDPGGTRYRKEDDPCSRGEGGNAPHISDCTAFGGGAHEGDGIHRGRTGHSTEFEKAEAYHTRHGNHDAVWVDHAEGEGGSLLPLGSDHRSHNSDHHIYHIQHHEGGLDNENSHTLLGYHRAWGGGSHACSDGPLHHAH